MFKKDKIEKILQRTNQQFGGFSKVKEEIKTKLFQQIEKSETIGRQKRLNIERGFLKLKLHRLATVSLIVFMILVFLSGGVIYAADFAAPGEFLYPLDRKIEDIQLKLANTLEKKNNLRINLLEERQREIEKLKKSNGNLEKIFRREELLNEMNSSIKEIKNILNNEGNQELTREKIKKMEKFLERLAEINKFIEEEETKIFQLREAIKQEEMIKEEEESEDKSDEIIDSLAPPAVPEIPSPPLEKESEDKRDEIIDSFAPPAVPEIPSPSLESKESKPSIEQKR